MYKYMVCFILSGTQETLEDLSHFLFMDKYYMKEYKPYSLDGNKITITNLDLSHDFKLVSNKLNKIADEFLSLVK